MPQNALGGYASLIGLKGTSNLENIVKSLLKSKKIKSEVALSFQSRFDDEIKELINSKELLNTPSHINNFVIT